MRSTADGFIAIDGAGSNDANRRLVVFHHAELGIGSMRAEKHVFSDVECVLHVASRVIGWEIQSFVVVVIAVDVRTVLNRKTHTGEDGEDMIHHFADGVCIAKGVLPARKGSIDFFIGDAMGDFCLHEAGKRLFAERAELYLEVVDLFAKERSLFRGCIAEMDHEVLDGPLFSQVFDFELFDVFAVLDLAEVDLELLAEIVEFFLHGIPRKSRAHPEGSRGRNYTSACFAATATAAKPLGSRIAISESILRFKLQPAFCKPEMNLL